MLLLVTVAAVASLWLSMESQFTATLMMVRASSGAVYFREQNPRTESGTTIDVTRGGITRKVDINNPGYTNMLPFVSDDGRTTTSKMVSYNPRTSITVDRALDAPTNSRVLGDKHDEIAAIRLPIAACTNECVAVLQRLKNLECLLVSGSPTKEDLSRLDELKNLLPSVQVKTTLPGFVRYRVLENARGSSSRGRTMK